MSLQQFQQRCDADAALLNVKSCKHFGWTTLLAYFSFPKSQEIDFLTLFGCLIEFQSQFLSHALAVTARQLD